MQEISEVVWIPSARNRSDALKKSNALKALKSLVKRNKIYLDVKFWVERPETPLATEVEPKKKNLQK